MLGQSRRRGRGDAERGTEYAWRRLGEERGGEVEVTSKGKPRRLCLPHRSWTIVLDTYVVQSGSTSSTYTRVRALFVRARPFVLRVTKRRPFHALGRLVGYRGVDLSYGPLDRKLFVRSDDATLARSLLRGTSVGQALIEDPGCKLEVKRPGRRIRKGAGGSVGEVQVRTAGEVREVARLRATVGLCTGTLDELGRLGVAIVEPVEDVEI